MLRNKYVVQLRVTLAAGTVLKCELASSRKLDTHDNYSAYFTRISGVDVGLDAGNARCKDLRYPASAGEVGLSLDDF